MNKFIIGLGLIFLSYSLQAQFLSVSPSTQCENNRNFKLIGVGAHKATSVYTISFDDGTYETKSWQGTNEIVFSSHEYEQTNGSYSVFVSAFITVGGATNFYNSNRVVTSVTKQYELAFSTTDVFTTCVNSTLSFSNLSSNGVNVNNTSQNRYRWQLEDSRDTTIKEATKFKTDVFSHHFTSVGDYALTLYSHPTIADFCTITEIQKNIKICGETIPQFTITKNAFCTAFLTTVSDFCPNTPLNITNTTINLGGCNLSYRWEIFSSVTSSGLFRNNQTISFDENPQTITFSKAGEYTILLSIENTSCGLFTTAMVVNVSQPLATISSILPELDNKCTNDTNPIDLQHITSLTSFRTVNGYIQGKDSNNQVVHYKWSGRGIVLNNHLINPKFQFIPEKAGGAGTHFLTCTFVSANGCCREFYQKITIIQHKDPDLSRIPKRVCQNGTIRLRDFLSTKVRNIMRANYVDNYFVTVTNVIFKNNRTGEIDLEQTKAGNHQVRLIHRDINNCDYNLFITFTLDNFITVKAGNDNQICLDSVLHLGGIPEGKLWELVTDATVSLDGAMFSTAFDGKYEVKYTIEKNVQTCEHFDIKVVTVHPLPDVPKLEFLSVHQMDKDETKRIVNFESCRFGANPIFKATGEADATILWYYNLDSLKNNVPFLSVGYFEPNINTAKDSVVTWYVVQKDKNSCRTSPPLEIQYQVRPLYVELPETYEDIQLPLSPVPCQDSLVLINPLIEDFKEDSARFQFQWLINGDSVLGQNQATFQWYPYQDEEPLKEETIVTIGVVVEDTELSTTEFASACFQTAQTHLTVYPRITGNGIKFKNLADSSVCSGDAESTRIGLLPDGQLSGGTSNWKYRWQRSLDKKNWENVRDESEFTEYSFITTNTYYRRIVQDKDETCTTISNFLTIQYIQTPEITIHTNDKFASRQSKDTLWFCKNEDFSIKTEAISEITWYKKDDRGNLIRIDPLTSGNTTTAGNYQLVTQYKGCPYFTDITIAELNLRSEILTPNSNNSGGFCPNTTLTLSAKPCHNCQYKWYRSNQLLGEGSKYTISDVGYYELQTIRTIQGKQICEEWSKPLRAYYVDVPEAKIIRQTARYDIGEDNRFRFCFGRYFDFYADVNGHPESGVDYLWCINDPNCEQSVGRNLGRSYNTGGACGELFLVIGVKDADGVRCVNIDNVYLDCYTEKDPPELTVSKTIEDNTVCYDETISMSGNLGEEAVLTITRNLGTEIEGNFVIDLPFSNLPAYQIGRGNVKLEYFYDSINFGEVCNPMPKVVQEFEIINLNPVIYADDDSLRFSIDGAYDSLEWYRNDVLFATSTTIQNTQEPYYLRVYSKGCIFESDKVLVSTEIDLARRGIKIYPNPTQTTLGVHSKFKPLKSLALYDRIGKQKMTQDIDREKFKLDISHLPVGTYILQIRLENELFLTKIIKN